MRRVLGVLGFCLCFLASTMPTRVWAAIQIWASPKALAPNPNAHFTIHVRGLPANAAVTLFIDAPAPSLGPSAVFNVTASPAGAIDDPVVVAAKTTGEWTVSAQLNSGKQVYAHFTVKAPVTTACAGTSPIAHVFTKKPELLIQGTIPKPGGTVWLLGIGYDPCSLVTFAGGPPNADFGLMSQQTRTDKFGDFRYAFRIPKRWPASILYLYPRVNTVNTPVVAIAVARS